jgi:hypothetical protein
VTSELDKLRLKLDPTKTKKRKRCARRLTDEQISLIRLMRSGGELVKDIASVVGTSEVTVRYYSTHGAKEVLTAKSHRNATERYRAHNLTTSIGGKLVRIGGLQKRPHPGYCELCSKTQKMFLYHHWDDDNPSLGLWVCHRCHNVIEVVDMEGSEEFIAIRSKYIKLKESIQELNNDYFNKPHGA